MVNMRVLLVKTLMKNPLSDEDVGIPLGLLYLASSIRKSNPKTEIKIFDSRLEKLNGNYNKLNKEIKKADIVCVGACTAEFSAACDILTKAKTEGKITIIGGLFPTSNAEFILNLGLADYVIRGEGEITFSELINAIENKKPVKNIKGISYIKKGITKNNPERELVKNIDTLPLPAYDLIKIKSYKKYGRAPIYSSRGCSNNCTFCTLRSFWGGCNREHSIKRATQEILMLKSFGYNSISFKDETMNLNKKRTEKILNSVKKENIDFKIKLMPFDLPTMFLNQIIKKGVNEIQLGIESINTKTAKEMHKRHLGRYQLEKKMNNIISNNCVINPIFLLGWPGEDEKLISKTKYFISEWAQRPNTKIYLSFTTPHPGTEFYNFCKKEMNILSLDLDKYTHLFPVAVPKSLGINGLEKLVGAYHEITDQNDLHQLNPPIKYEDLLPLIEMEEKIWKLKSKPIVSNQHSQKLETSY
jgi:anaerobic magnesium-protoporphyrin IX monomethyl ester cyclase